MKRNERDMTGGTDRHAWITATIVLLLAPLVLSIEKRGLSAPLYQQLHMLRTVRADTPFRILRRNPANHFWDNGSPFARQKAIALIKAADLTTQWNPDSDGKLACVLPPGLELGLEWWDEESQRKERSLYICYGNGLFWHGDGLYELPYEARAIAGSLFPENELKPCTCDK